MRRFIKKRRDNLILNKPIARSRQNVIRNDNPYVLKRMPLQSLTQLLTLFHSTFVEFNYLFYICRESSKCVEMQLSKSEEELMNYLWKLEKAFMKDLLEAYPEPKPATTTVATLLKRMADKQFIDHTLYGNSRQYFPLVKKADYFSKHVNGLIKNFFNDSSSQFASFFTKETNLSKKELEELRAIIDLELENK